MARKNGRLETLAFFGLYTPKRTGMVDYSEDLARELAPHIRLTFYHDDGNEPTVAGQWGEVRHFSEYRRREGLALFQIANNADLSFQYFVIKRYGGVVTLHDEIQYDLVFGAYRDRWHLFPFELLYNEGLRGLRNLLAHPKWPPRLYWDQILTNYIRVPDKRTRFPFRRRIPRSADALVTHSTYLRDVAKGINPRCPVRVIPHGVHPVEIPRTRNESRRLLGLERRGIGPETFVILSFGFIQEHKRLTQVLEAFAPFHARHPDSHFLVIGPREAEYRLEDHVARLGLGGAVTVLDTYIPMEQVNEHINAADLGFNLRWPTMGANSGTLNKILAVGRPVVVTNSGSFAEFPDGCVFKVDVGEGEVERLGAVLEELHRNPGKVEAMSRFAKDFADRTLTWPAVGKAYLGYLREVRAGTAR